MEDMSVAESADLIERFREVTFPQRYIRIVKGYNAINVERRRRVTGFNIFKILGVDQDEVNTHSALIKELLDPYGSHGEGFLFLESFLEQCTKLNQVIGKLEDENCDLSPEAFPVIDGDLSVHDWNVEAERWIEGDRYPDIVIECETLGFLCVIENKVGADEGEDQLIAYWNWMREKERAASFPKQALVYLTPKGRISDYSHCLAYFPMSYRQHIASWLQETIPKVQTEDLKSLITQYLLVVDEIGGSMSRTDDLTRYLMRADHLETLFDIQEAFEAWDGNGRESMDPSVQELLKVDMNHDTARSLVKQIRPIKREILTKFGLDLSKAFKDRIADEANEYWELRPVYHEMWTKNSAGWGLVPKSDQDPLHLPCLYVNIQRTRKYLNLGIARTYKKTKNPEREVKEVKELERALVGKGFGTHDMWVGFKHLYDLRKEEFYLEASGARDVLVEDLTSAFWNLYNEYLVMLKEANRALEQFITQKT